MSRPPSSEPLFNIPPFILIVVGTLMGIHALRDFVLDEDTNVQLFLNLALIPKLLLGDPIAIKGLIELQTPVIGTLWHTLATYALLHGSWEHAFWNCVWLLIFGTPLARGLAWWRVSLLFFTAVIAGGVAHLVLTGEDGGTLIGASGGIAALTGAAMRMLSVDGGLAFRAANTPKNGRLNLAPLDSPTLLTFSIIWIALNMVPLLFGQTTEAWYTHLLGYAIGIFMIDVIQPSASSPQRKF